MTFTDKQKILVLIYLYDYIFKLKGKDNIKKQLPKAAITNKPVII